MAVGKRMRILISAFGFSPYRGSECAVGWNIARELAKLHDVTVITGDVKESGLEDEYPSYVKENGKVEGLTVIYLKPTKLIAFIDRLHELPGLWAFYYVAYRLWQRLAFEKAKELHAEKPFDIVHHLTMIGYREPGYMWRLGIPFFWGPVGGSVNEPLRYWKMYSNAARIKVMIRFIINGFQKRFMIRTRKAARAAKKIWAVSPADVHTISEIWGCKCEQMVESAATPTEGARVRTWDGKSVFRIVWSGTHTYGKALPILIHALERLKDLRAEIKVDVLGRGEETNQWKKLAIEYGVAKQLNWIGYVPRSEALKIMNEAHCLVFTSVKEGTPHVVLEALSLGLPVICHDACGMGIVVDERCGIKIKMNSPDESIRGFSEAIRELLKSSQLVEQYSCGALVRANELTWEKKTRKIADAYAAG